MTALLWLQWWYGAGWADCVRRAGLRLERLERSFSIGILLRTLFAPWKQVVSLSDGAVQDRMRAALDNLISRCVGLAVRSLALVTAAIVLSVSAIIAFLLVVIWPLLPVLPIVLLAMAVLV